MYVSKPENLLFNVNDLTLLIAAAQYCLLAILIYFTRSGQKISYGILVAILLLNASQTIDTLILWSEPIRVTLLRSHPNVFFLGSLGYWLQGPLLLWYVKSTLYKDFRFTARDCVHLVPALVILSLLVATYYRLTPAEKYEQMFEMQFMWTQMMGSIKALRYLFIIAYGCCCLYVLTQYRQKLAHEFSNIELQKRSWLTWIVAGVIVLAGLNLLNHLIGNIVPYHISNALGLVNNYLNLIFATSLVFLHARYSHFFEGINIAAEADPEEEHEHVHFKPENIQRIENYMRQHKPYLDSDVTLEGFAQRLSLPERTVSRIINGQFDKNFFEFINEYRVEEAKRFLADKNNSNAPILDAMTASGFRSKSSFNVIFKKATGLTPTQFRKGSADRLVTEDGAVS